MKLLVACILFLLPGLLYAQPSPEEPVSDDPAEVYKHYYSLARELMDSDPVKALEMARLSLEGAEETRLREKIAKAHFIVGKAAYKCGNYLLSYEHYRRSQHLHSKIGNVADSLLCDWGISGIQVEIRQFDKAVRNYEKIEATLMAQLPPEEKARLTRDIGNLHIESGNFAIAISTYEKALGLFQSALNKSWCHMRIGFCLNALDYPDSATIHYRLALYHSQEANHTANTTRSLNFLGYHAIQNKNYDQAIDFLLEARAQSQLVTYEPTLGIKSARNLAIAYFEMGEDEKAANVLREVLTREDLPAANRETVLVFDLLMKRYLMPKRLMAELEAVFDQRVEFDTWIANNPSPSKENLAAQIKAIEAELAKEFLIEDTRPIRRNNRIYLALVALLFVLLTLGYLFFFRPQSRLYKATRKELERYRDHFARVKQEIGNSSL